LAVRKEPVLGWRLTDKYMEKEHLCSKLLGKKGSSKYRVWSKKVLAKHRVLVWTKTPSKNRFQAGKMIVKIGQFRKLLLKIQSLV
jgi:hypothetical protein